MNKTTKWYAGLLYVVMALALVAGLTVVPVAPVSAADTTGPVLSSIAWADVDNSTDISGGDTLTFTFLEDTAMDSTTITAASIDVDLLTSGVHDYGTAADGLMLAWDDALEVLTVTLGTTVDIVSGETVNPAVTVTDVLGNPDATVAPGPAITDDVGPTLDSIVWTGGVDAGGLDAGDTLVFTFSETMNTNTITADNVNTVLATSLGHTYGTGATIVWTTVGGETDNTLTVTLAAGFTVADGDTVNPTAAVTDTVGNSDATAAGVAIDGLMPTLSSIAWTDVDDSTDISATDTLAFTFSEAMDPTTITTADAATTLLLSAHTYGTGFTVAWSAGDTVVTVTLGTDTSIVGGETVNPANAVTDVAGFIDATAAGVAITDDVGPRLESIGWQDGKLVFTFSETMEDTTVDEANINTVLATSGGYAFDYGAGTGDGLLCTWSDSDTVLTVTLGGEAGVVGGETVDPTDAVTDFADNPDETVDPVSLPLVGGIQAAITAAAVGGTVNVLPGIYDLEATLLTIGKAGLTLQSTGTAAETIIDATGITGDAIKITADGVTVDGFTVQDAGGVSAITVYAASNATVKNNIMTSPGEGYASGIYLTHIVTGATVSGNELDFYNPMIVGEGSSECTISGNTFDAGLELQASTASTTDLNITDNIIIGSGACGIVFTFGGVFDNILIEGNTISETLLWSGFPEGGISFPAANTITNVTITGNDITNNEDLGIAIASTTTWGAGNTINNNNIYGNLGGGLTFSLTGKIVNAENNWWGDDSGPYVAATNTAGKGDIITETAGSADYRPWLSAAYSAPVAEVTTIDLVAGWNLVSPMLYIPTANQTPATFLASVVDNVDIVWGYDAATGNFSSYVLSAPPDLTEIRDGKGYWINMTAADTLDVSALGTELPAPPAAPPTYDVVEGWNLIGFKSLTGKNATAYLGPAVSNTMEAMYGYNATADAYTTIQAATDLVPGDGYWLAVNANGTIYP